MNIPMSAAPAIETSVPDSIEALTEMLERAPDFDAARAYALLANLDVSAEDLRPWHDFNHSVRDSYGRLLIKRGANFELMVMSWAPGDYSAIHDHGVAEWGAVRYFGAADHIIFTEKHGALSVAQRMTMRSGDVFAVEPALIHLMGNPTRTPFISLHLYGRTQPAESITGKARIFDLHENTIQRTDGGVFFCLPESDIRARESCPVADARTRLLHHKLMLTRIERILKGTGFDPALGAKAEQLRGEIRHLHSQKFSEVKP